MFSNIRANSKIEPIIPEKAADDGKQGGGEYIAAQPQYSPQRSAHTGQHCCLIEPRRHQQPERQGQKPAEQGGDAHGNDCGGGGPGDAGTENIFHLKPVPVFLLAVMTIARKVVLPLIFLLMYRLNGGDGFQGASSATDTPPPRRATHSAAMIHRLSSLLKLGMKEEE